MKNNVIENAISELEYVVYKKKLSLLEKWVSKFHPGLTENSDFSTIQLIELHALLLKAKEIDSTIALSLPENHPSFPIAKTVTDLMKNSGNSIHAFQKQLENIKELSPNDKLAATAAYINRKKLPIVDVLKEISKEKCLELSPHIRYVNLNEFKDVEFGTKLIKNNPNINILLISNTNIKELPAELLNCQILDCTRCHQLQALPAALPVCRTLCCFDCRLLQALPAVLPNCQELTCSCCPQLQALPEALPNCQYLDCSNCPQLQALPAALPYCRCLTCYNCPQLQVLPELSYCKYLTCFNCPKLQALPATLPSCQELDCSNCPKLQVMPELPYCRILKCFKCLQLQALPATLPSCQELDCTDCPKLQVLPELLYCRILKCSECHQLQALPAVLPVCRTLCCYDCPQLQALPTALPNCQRLNCYECPQLQALPTALPNCQELDCSDCALLQGMLPELPRNARVYAYNTPLGDFTMLNVEFEELKNHPAKVLLELGNTLLHGHPFPNVYYYENGQPSGAVDAGGVRRDLVTRLFERILSENREIASLPSRNGMPLNDGTEHMESAYRTIGCLFALCYPESSYFKAGPFLPEKAYDLIASMHNPASEENLISTYLRLIEAPSVVTDILEGKKIDPIEDQDLLTISYILNVDGNIKIDQDYFKNPENRKYLRERILENATKEEVILPLVWIAQEMQNSLGEQVWSCICNEGGMALQERIEGKLTPQLLLDSLTYMPGLNVSEDDAVKTKTFLTNWIHHDKPEELSLFVRGVTGNRTLGPTNKLKIELYNREPGRIPTSHTCYFSLELPASYPDQDHFNEKIHEFLTNAMAGSGFQFG